MTDNLPYHETMGKDSSDTGRHPPPERGVFCSRTLNLRAIRAIGYDMDYTLIHYHVDEWERRAFAHMKQKLTDRGWPVKDLEFDPQAFQRGLFIDRHLGNIVKANEFGYVKRASHGLKMLDFDTQRRAYSETIVDPSDERFVFLNTLFSISEASMYAQLVGVLDRGKLPEVIGYPDLYDILKRSFQETHMEGTLKAEITADPERFVDLDPGTPLVLLDQKEAGDRILLITNSGWTYVHSMMSYAFDRFLPPDMTWRDLFDIIVVSARKPVFFQWVQPFFEVIDEEGRLLPVTGTPEPGKILLGGHAGIIEEMLGLRGNQFLYVGDHAYDDVHVSKSIRRWRTALVVRELEEEILAQESFRDDQRRLTQLMIQKSHLEARQARIRLELQHIKRRRPRGEEASAKELEAELERLRNGLVEFDEKITPLAQAASELRNPSWGLLMRTGNDRSYIAGLVERHADIYTSRVSNLLSSTPFAFFRAYRSLLPHDEVNAQTQDST